MAVPVVVAAAFRYALTFLLYGLLGYLYERFIVGKDVGVFPFLPIYAFGAVILRTISDVGNVVVPPSKTSSSLATRFALLVAKVITASIVLTSFECACGHLSKWRHNGVHTWRYDDATSACDGYVSLQATAVWTGLALLYFLLDPVTMFLG